MNPPAWGVLNAPSRSFIVSRRVRFPAHNQAVTRWGMLIVVAFFIALSSGYVYITPYRESGVLLNQRTVEGAPAPAADIGAPDERQHANYVRHLLTGNGLPVLDPKDPNLGENYQSHQAPLYYLLTAGLAKVTGWYPDSHEGIHLRLLNVLIGGITCLGLYQLIKLATGSDSASLLGTTLTAFMPMVLALHGAISNDPLLYCLCTWALVWLLKADAMGWTWQRALILGLLMGLAIDTKTTAVALLPIVVMAAVFGRREPAIVRGASIALVTAILIAMPWWIRNTNLYGDPLAIGVFAESFTGNPRTQDMVAALGPVRYWTEFFGWWSLRSFFGVFGYMDIFWSSNIYRVLATILTLIALGLLRAGRLGLNPPSQRGRLYVYSFLGLILLLYLQFNLTYFQAQARYVYPAIGAIGLGLGTALLVWGGRAAPKVVPGLISLMLILNLLNLSWLPAEFERRTSEAKNHRTASR